MSADTPILVDNESAGDDEPRRKRKKPEAYQFGLCTTQSLDDEDPMSFVVDKSDTNPNGIYFDAQRQVTPLWIKEYGQGPHPLIQRLLDSKFIQEHFDVCAGQWEVGETGTLHYQWVYRFKKEAGKDRSRKSVQHTRNMLCEGMIKVNGVTYTSDVVFKKLNTHFQCGTSGLRYATTPSFKKAYNYCTYEVYPDDWHDESKRGTRKRLAGTVPFIYNPLGVEVGEDATNTSVILGKFRKGAKVIDVLDSVPVNMCNSVRNIYDMYLASKPLVGNKCGNHFCNRRHMVLDLETYGPALLKRYQAQRNADYSSGVEGEEFKAYLEELSRPCAMQNLFLWGEAKCGKTTDAVDMLQSVSLMKTGDPSNWCRMDSNGRGFYGTRECNADGAEGILWNEIDAAMFENSSAFKNNFECPFNKMNVKNACVVNRASLNIATSNACPLEFMEKLYQGSIVSREEYCAFLRRWTGFYHFRKPNETDKEVFRLHNVTSLPFQIVAKAKPPSYVEYCERYAERKRSAASNPFSAKLNYKWELEIDTSSSSWKGLMNPHRLNVAEKI